MTTLHGDKEPGQYGPIKEKSQFIKKTFALLKSSMPFY